MGGIFSGRGKQKTSKEILEKLEVTIKTLAEGKRSNAQYERSFIGYLLITSFLAYLIGALIFYLYFLPTTWMEGLLHTLPLILFPIIVYLIKKLLNMYFSHRTTEFDAQLRTLHEEKRKVLNEVMETETYKTARELLERFDPTNPSLQNTRTTPRQQRDTNKTRVSQSEVRHRRPPQTPHPTLVQHHVAMATPQQQGGHPVTMATPQVHRGPPVVMTTPQVQREPPVVMTTPQVQREPPVTMTTPTVNPSASGQQAAPIEPLPTSQPSLQHIPPGMCLGAAPGPPTPCPILPRDRSNVDKMVEYLVGDGPNNRYALICSNCKSHNGMALRDEFEYLAFRCAYCYTLNSARAKRPSLQPSADPLRKDKTTSEGEGRAEAVPSGGDGHSNNQHSPRIRHRSRGQRLSSASSEDNHSPIPPEND